MKIRDIVTTVAEELGLTAVISYLQGVSNTSGETETNNLVRCYNLVEGELAVDYLPLYAEDEIWTDTGAVFYTELSKKAVRIVAVTDENGNGVPYKIFPEYLKAQAGKICVRYSYVPTEKGLEEDSDYQLLACKHMLVYGVATEYCLATGLFEEAEVWEKKYRRAVKNAYKSKPSVVMHTRRWA
ncbi:MAG: hypothetical protein IJ996_05765 [Clostridia bacterium]|nr:hypothetical protein [Clostridia bacterium]